MTRLDVVRSILLEWRGKQDTFGLRQLAMEVEARWGHWVLEDTVRKEADMLKSEFPFVRESKGVRRFVFEPEQLIMGGL